jgi:hypothetical protein
MAMATKTLPRTALISLLLCLCSCPKIGDLLRSFGFTELRPPSQLMRPGTMVWVEHTKPFKAGIICTQATSLGPNFVPIESPTSSQTLQRAANVQVDAGADILELLKFKTDVHAMHKVSVELQNPVVYTLSDMDVLQALPNRDPLCAQAISSRLQAGFPVTMISKALMADVSYTIVWKQGLEIDARAKAEMLSQIAPHLGVTQGTVTENSISGKSLFWGIQDDVYLSKLALGSLGSVSAANPTGSVPARQSEEPERIIDTDAIAEIAPHIDTDAIEQNDPDWDGPGHTLGRTSPEAERIIEIDAAPQLQGGVDAEIASP